MLYWLLIWKHPFLDFDLKGRMQASSMSQLTRQRRRAAVAENANKSVNEER